MSDTGPSTSDRATIGRTWADSSPHFDPPAAAPADAPNIVLVLLDDLGWSDFGCFGSEIDTPTADRLAAEGLRYTDFHVTPVCSPTRACLLTGRNHHSVGMGLVPNFPMGYPGYRGVMSKSTATLGEMLQGSGYSTYMVGKWHLTPMNQFSGAGPYDQWPVQRGFDRYYGTPDGLTNQFTPDLLCDNHWLDVPNDDDYHFSADIVDRAIDMARDHRHGSPDRPFFQYIAFCAPHFPHHVPRPYVEKYLPVFEKGWDRTREDRLARQKELGLVDADTRLPPRNPGVAAWDDHDDEAKEAMVHLQAAFAGMVEHTDEQLGRYVDALEEMGELDNTLFLLLSDNGASQEGGPVGSLDSMRFFTGWTTPEDEIAEIREHLDTIGGPRWMNNYAIGWSMASNTPLKRWKQDTHAGGVRSPLIVRFPGEIDDAGGVRRRFHHAVDLVPTVLDLLGLEAPDRVKGVAQKPLEGASFRSTFADPDAATTRSVQYFEMNGQRALWQDGWKAVTHHEPALEPMFVLSGQAAEVTDFDADTWELYHLDRDWNEVVDLAAEEPERLRAMVETWWREAEAHDALPLGALINGMQGPPAMGRPPRRSS
jgi:arylsulfatase